MSDIAEFETTGQTDSSPDISILMPTLNQDRFLVAAIDSVLDQEGDYQIDLIVVDGGSTDETLSILEGYGDRLRWISEPDDGQADALNKGRSMVRANVVGWLNSDDVYEERCFSKVLPLFESSPEVDWVYGKVRIIDENDREIRRWITSYKTHRMKRFSLRKLMTENWISQMGVFWRKSISDAVGPFRPELRYTMDYDYWLRFAKISPGQFIDEWLACFRWYETSKSGHNFRRQMEEDLQTAIHHADGAYEWEITQHRFHRWKIVTAYTMMNMFRGHHTSDSPTRTQS